MQSKGRGKRLGGGHAVLPRGGGSVHASEKGSCFLVGGAGASGEQRVREQSLSRVSPQLHSGTVSIGSGFV